MKYIIMCGGDYKCSEPKHFTKVLNDERIIDINNKTLLNYFIDN